MSDEITINKNKAWKYGALVLVVAVIITTFMNFNNNSESTNQAAEGAQKIVLSYKNYNYYPNTLRVKEGEPVSITLDKTITGCFRSLVIKDLAVNEFSSSPKETIDFTPTKKGTFKFACSMGMGYGTLIVE